MTPGWQHAGDLLSGPLLLSGAWPLLLRATLCDLRPRFLPKGAVGVAGHRAVSRNGRVLLCADQPPAALTGVPALVRLQTWHRAILPGDEPQPYGLLLCVRVVDRLAVGPGAGSFTASLAPRGEGGAELTLDVGGRLVLQFRAAP